MVLKVCNCGASIFYGEIEKISSRWKAWKDVKDMVFDGLWFEKDPLPDTDILLCVMRRAGNDTELVVGCDSAYLLGDNGRTIERL